MATKTRPSTLARERARVVRPPRAPRRPAAVHCCKAPPAVLQERPAVRCLTYGCDQPQVLQAIDTLSDALASDPSTSFFCRPGQHHQFYEHVMRASLQLHPDNIQVYSIDDHACVAVAYTYPHSEEPTLWKQVRVSLRPLLSVRMDKWAVGAAASDYFDARKQLYYKAHGPFTYIMLFGTRPDRQRQGLGSALLRHLTALADTKGQHCYVEATSLQNRSFYLRHGFQELHIFQPREDCPPTYIMVRPPAGWGWQGAGSGCEP